MISIISCTNRPGALTYQICLLYKKALGSLQEESQIIDLQKLPEDFAFSALYNNSGKNHAFNLFNELIAKSEKFVLVIPEYNGSFPGVLKTFIDGLDYPSPFRGKVAGLVGVSAGEQGATLALSHMTDILNYLGCNVLAIKPKCIRLEQKFSNGIVDDEVFNQLLLEQASQLKDY